MKILFLALSYLFGSLPTGYLAYRLSERRDIRDFGSLNTGATNVMRLKGWKLAVPVAVVDVLKGFLPAFLALRHLQGAQPDAALRAQRRRAVEEAHRREL